MFEIANIENTKVQGKTLKEWATTNPEKLEVMIENQFDEELREQMTAVYAHYNLQQINENRL